MTTSTTTPTTTADPTALRPAARRGPGALDAALCGVAATLAALGVSELAAGILGGQSLVAAVGGFIIDSQPAGAKDFVVGLFGTNDKLALELFILGVALLIGAGVGLLARRSFTLAALVIVGFAAAGFLAGFRDPSTSPVSQIFVAGAAGIAGVQVLAWLIGRAPVAGEEAPGATAGMPNWSRRGFLIRSGSVAAASVVAGVAGRNLLEGARGAPTTGETTVPPAAQPASLPTGASFDVEGVTPIVMPNDRFYRIDTALLTPNVELATWQLTIKGMVERETVLSYADLANLPIIEQYVTIACVSNEVGGNLVGNAKWTGVRLRDVLDIAGVQAGATQLVGRSVDGWTAGMPTEWVMDPARDPMIALKMNDEVLPRNHGFPARLIVPGLYGYVSATKWLSELELTTWEAFDGYWVPLGWSKEGPILTQSRIDVPRSGAQVGSGRVAIAGVAWAPDRGISKVEIAIDGEWRDAQISTPISNATWVQWTYAWDSAASGVGPHTIEVRATDGTGAVQTDAVTPPAPDGARGHDRHSVFVSD
ncbi:MAG TPA: molybdopterin-dependent oxidoreductase [Candidatus Limnocylindrales bacterium]|nr:molybdopterin-dependent oxidoreductase [Candidatus Limnocylindrales bacterium]